MTVPELFDSCSFRIDTDRLVIRPPQPGDGLTYHQAVRDSLSNLRRWPASLRWALDEPSEESSETYCQSAWGKFEAQEDFVLLLTLRGTREIVGACGLHDPDWAVPALEIGWWGRTGYLSQGLITEGTSAVLEWGLETLKARRIYATVDEENADSCRICERIGMDYEGLIRHMRADPDGQLRNFRLYAAIR